MCTVYLVGKERISVAVIKGVHKRFAEVCKSRAVGRSMNDAATRIFEWFCRQEPVVQTAIANDVDEGMEHAYAAALEALAAKLRADAAAPKVDPTMQKLSINRTRTKANPPPPPPRQ
jgi:hypothetical protein